MTEIMKECLGNFVQAKMTDRLCSKCNSIAICIKETDAKPKKMYISIKQMENNELKKSILSERPIFIEKMMNEGLAKRTSEECWKLLQKVCIIKEKSPKDISILDISDFLEMKTDTPYLPVMISHFRRISKDYYQWENWNIIQPTQNKQKKFRTVYDPNFLESEIYKDWEEWFKVYSYELDTAKQHKNLYKRFLFSAWRDGIKDSKDVDALIKHAKKWVKTQPIRPTTKKLYRSMLKQYFETHLESLKFKVVFKPVPDAKPKLKIMPKDTEIKMLLKYTKMKLDEPWLYPFYTTIVYTGIRIRDICRIHVEDVDKENNMFHLSETKTGDADNQIPEPLRPILYRYFEQIKQNNNSQIYLFEKENGEIPTPNSTRDLLRVISKKLGIPYYPPHHYRSRIAQIIYKNSGYNKEFVRDFLGHRSIKTTETYLRGFRVEIMRQDYSQFIPDLTPEFELNYGQNDQ